MKYRKKPVIVEAMQYDGTNFLELNKWSNHQIKEDITPYRTRVVILTLKGDIEVSIGDYVIKGVRGELYLCKPDIFAQTYEAVEEVE